MKRKKILNDLVIRVAYILSAIPCFAQARVITRWNLGYIHWHLCLISAYISTEVNPLYVQLPIYQPDWNNAVKSLAWPPCSKEKKSKITWSLAWGGLIGYLRILSMSKLKQELLKLCVHNTITLTKYIIRFYMKYKQKCGYCRYCPSETFFIQIVQ